MVGPVLPSLDADYGPTWSPSKLKTDRSFLPPRVSRTTPTIDAQPLLSFCSNDYLGLSGTLPGFRAAAAIARSDLAGASR